MPRFLVHFEELGVRKALPALVTHVAELHLPVHHLQDKESEHQGESKKSIGQVVFVLPILRGFSVHDGIKLLCSVSTEELAPSHIAYTVKRPAHPIFPASIN